MTTDNLLVQANEAITEIYTSKYMISFNGQPMCFRSSESTLNNTLNNLYKYVSKSEIAVTKLNSADI